MASNSFLPDCLKGQTRPLQGHDRDGGGWGEGVLLPLHAFSLVLSALLRCKFPQGPALLTLFGSGGRI